MYLIHFIEGNENSAKPEMKDCGTQTQPPTSPNSVLNNSQEHLVKVNNNCNVGNGPLALIQGSQIKDLPL